MDNLDTPAPVAFVLVVRAPDYANEFTTEGAVAVVDIDLGSHFTNAPADDADALEWVESMAVKLDVLPTGSSILGTAIDVYAEAVEDYANAGHVVEAYRIRRAGSPRLVWALHSEAGDVMPEAVICSHCLTSAAEIEQVVELAQGVEGDVYGGVDELKDATEETSLNCGICGYKHRRETPTSH